MIGVEDIQVITKLVQLYDKYWFFVDKVPVGSVCLVFKSKWICIHSFIIRRKYRGKGYGQLLIENIIAKAGSLHLTLYAHNKNKIAVNLYLKNGFQVKHQYDDECYYFRKSRN